MAIPQFIAMEKDKDYRVGARIARGTGGAIYHAIAMSSELKKRSLGHSIVAKNVQCKPIIIFNVLNSY